MAKLKLQTREIGAVNVFDLEGVPTEESLQEIVSKIQKKIRRHRMQRVILNLKRVRQLEAIGMRKLLAACLRPKRSLIFGASKDVLELIEGGYMPTNVILCDTEAEVAEDLGPFLLEKERSKEIAREGADMESESIGHKVERRRSKRMHVAMPVVFSVKMRDGAPLKARAIITNISEGGLFAEFLDLSQAQVIEGLDPIEGANLTMTIPPCANFPDEYQVEGVVTRKEVRKKQLGLAVKFIES